MTVKETSLSPFRFGKMFYFGGFLVGSAKKYLKNLYREYLNEIKKEELHVLSS